MSYDLELEKIGITPARRTTCPKCSQDRKKQNDKCLAVSVDEGIWYCHHCGYTGTVRTNENGIIARQTGYTKPTLRPQLMPESFFVWFEKRGISRATVEQNKITAQEVFMPNAKAKTLAIAFGYYRANELIGVKFRDLQKNFTQAPSAEKIFYGLDTLDDGTECVICEGEMDKLAFDEAGVKNALSVPDGAPSSDAKTFLSKFSFLENCQSYLTRMTRIVLATDNDEPGKRLEEELARRLGYERVYRVKWPYGCKDANDVLVKFGKEAVIALVQNAGLYPLDGVIQVEHIANDIDLLYTSGKERGISTGWHTLDWFYTVRPGELTILTGVPAHGKSTFMDALMVNLANSQNWSFAVCSPENLPIARHCASLLEKLIGSPFFEGPMPRITSAELAEGKKFLASHFYFVMPAEDKMTIEHILALALALVKQKGIQALVIDPWNEIDHSRASNLSETEYVSKCLTSIRRFARLYNVHVFLIAHPAKLQRDKNGKYPVPSGYDISGSAHFRNKADNLLCIWRDIETDDPTDVHIQKVRFKEVGQPGLISLQFHKASGRYSCV